MKGIIMASKKQKPIGIGIVGLGRAGYKMHCRDLRERTDKFKIVAACDVEEDRVKMMEEEFGCKGYTDVRKMVKDPDVELVDIATRSPDHTPHAILALKQDKHVFVEKPIGLSYKQARGMKTAEAKSKGKVFVRHNRRFEPAFQHIREIIKSKILGKVFQIRLARQSYSRRNDWQMITDQGGGQLLNWGPHLIDHALVFMNNDVNEIWSELKKETSLGDAEDHVHIIMKDKKDLTVTIEISGAGAITGPAYVIFGSKGALTCSGDEIRLRYLDPDHKLPRRRLIPDTPPLDVGFNYPDDLKFIEKTVKVDPEYQCQTSTIWDVLYESIRNRKKYPIELDHSLQVMKIVDAVKKGTPFEIK